MLSKRKYLHLLDLRAGLMAALAGDSAACYSPDLRQSCAGPTADHRRTIIVTRTSTTTKILISATGGADRSAGLRVSCGDVPCEAMSRQTATCGGAFGKERISRYGPPARRLCAGRANIEVSRESQCRPC